MMRLEDWLVQFNERASNLGIPHRQRPWQALSAWSLDSGVAIPLDGSVARQIFEWFEANSPPNAHDIGALYQAAFYFDAACWPVKIPLGFGAFQLDARKALTTMPDSISTRLFSEPNRAKEYVRFWCDCLDYGYGFASLFNVYHNSSRDLLIAGDRQLRAAASLLLENGPNLAAKDTARSACEIFLKCFLSHHQGIELKMLADRSYGHNLPNLIKKCLEHPTGDRLKPLEGEISQFPDVGDRYSGKSWHIAEVWYLYGLAQFAATSFVRTVTNYDTRPQFEASGFTS